MRRKRVCEIRKFEWMCGLNCVTHPYNTKKQDHGTHMNVAVCCSMLQSVAACCSVLQCVVKMTIEFTRVFVEPKKLLCPIH